MKKYAFGVDIGGTTCKIGFFDTNGTLLDNGKLRPIQKIMVSRSFPMSQRQWTTSWHRKRSARMMCRESESEFRDRLTARAWYTAV